MNQTLILNPKYYFVNDIDRVSLRSKRTSYNAMEDLWLSFVHPIQAYILGLFNNGNTISLVAKQIENEFGVDATKIAKLLLDYVENDSCLNTMFLGQSVILPEKVLIPFSEVLKKETVNRSPISLEEYDFDKISLTPDRLHRAPRSLLFMLSSKCKTRCKYCYAQLDRKHKELSYPEIESIFIDAKKTGVDYVDLIGGEVFCHSNWNQIIAKLVDLGMMPSYLSTKVALSKDEIKTLVDTGYTNVVQLSIDSFDDDDLQNIIGRKCYVQRLKQTALDLCEAGVPLQINTILTKHSSPSKLLDLYTFMTSLPTLLHWEIRVPEVSIYTRNEFAEIRATREELEGCLDFINSQILPSSTFNIYISRNALDTSYQQHKPEENMFPTGSCGILYDRLFILPDGKVSVCEQLYWHPQFLIGDLRCQTIEEVWNSSKAKLLFENIQSMYPKQTQCLNCASSGDCHRKMKKCWVKVIKAYGELNWHYPDPHCIMAPAYNHLLEY